MLNELEKNKKDTAGGIPSNIEPTFRKQRGTFRWRIVYWTLIIIIAATAIWYFAPHKNIDIAKTIASFKKTPAPTVTPPQETPPVPEKEPTPEPEPKPVINKIQNIILEHQHDKTTLDFVLDSPTTYYIEHAGEQQLSIVLNNIGLPGNMPVSLDNSFIAALNNQENNNNTVCTLTLLPGTKIDDLQLIDQPQPLLRLVLANPQLTKGSMSKQPSALSPEQIILKQYQEIQQQLLTKEKPETIIRKLRLFLGDHPDHLEARSLLVSLLIKIGQPQKANTTLMVGLDKNKNYLPFIKLKAYILIKQNNQNAAIMLLKKHIAKINDAEYISLLASLYQKQGQFIEAAELYSDLAKAQPEKTSWWLGLGIALESADKDNAAKEAYARAYNTSDVPEELKQFLNDKLKN